MQPIENSLYRKCVFVDMNISKTPQKKSIGNMDHVRNII